MAACGDDAAVAPPNAATAGSGGSGGTSNAGQGGAAGTQIGKGGISGGAGAAGAPSNAGSAGTIGAAGTAAGTAGNGGTAGTSGAGGANGGCAKASDCPAPPIAVPSGCVVATCVAGKCGFGAVDADGDGHPTRTCKADAVITLGDDCNDSAPDVFPGAWDGPGTDGKPDRCADGIDQDCSGKDGDGVGSKGASCTCVPGDTATCATGADGKTITFPGGSPQGECKLGARQCVLSAGGEGGVWGPCVGAVGPAPEVCNGKKDDDCDGFADMADKDTPPTNAVTYSYDGDGDGFVSKTGTDAKRLRWCADGIPEVCPTDVPGCDLTRWTSGTLPAGDCDDASLEAAPGGVEICDGVDNDCNGVKDDPYASDAKVWVWDWDGDDFGDIDVKPVRSCAAPKDVPAYCASLASNVPADYATGIPAEGSPPPVPVAACDASMWKTGFPNTDCKDNPSQTGGRGNKPHLVSPNGKDLCNGLDYSCDGSPNGGCPCALTDPPVECGNADSCNAGTQTCGLVNGVAVLSKCSGGIEKDKIVYCPDDDGDGYCNLEACTQLLCPGTAPSDHSYKARNLCAGEALPNNRGNDCNDDPTNGGAKANPGVGSEKCDGTGVDYNCNGVVNTPGLGDCACNTGDKVACAPAGLEYPSAPPSDQYPLGAPPPLKGVCAWGEKTCLGGAWTSCGGGVGATSQELCNNSGKDHNCNGIVNTAVPPAPVDCGCQNGQTAACGPCGTGVQTCNAGVYGACAGDASKIEYCLDGDGDGVCAGCSFVCPNALPSNSRPKIECHLNGIAIDCADGDPTRGQNKNELCGGTDEDCDGIVNEGYDQGAVCEVGNGVGACQKGGTKVCSGNPATSTVCQTQVGVGAQTCQTVPSAPADGSAGSWDWDCDGVREVCVGNVALTVAPTDRSPGGPEVLRTGSHINGSAFGPPSGIMQRVACETNSFSTGCPDVRIMMANDCPGGSNPGSVCPNPCGGKMYLIRCSGGAGQKCSATGMQAETAGCR